MKRRNKKEKLLNIKISQFKNLLNNIYLNGLIEECVIKLSNKNAVIEAVDLSNSIYVYSKMKILKSSIDEIELGISDIDIIKKFVNTINDTKINAVIKKNVFSLIRDDAKRSIIYLLKDIDIIATVPDKKDIYKKILNIQECYSEIDQVFAKDLTSYINMLGKDSTKEVNIKYNGDEILFLCGENNENQLSLILENKITKIDKDCDDFNNIVNGEYLSKILNTISFDSESKPKIYFGEEKPVVIKTKDTLWALSPLVKE